MTAPAAPTYGACVIQLVGSEVRCTRADRDVRISDYVVNLPGPGMYVEGNLVSMRNMAGELVEYLLVGWDANAEAHKATRLPAVPVQRRPRPQ